MKVRNGFVSNSSSSSFILRNKEDIETFKKQFPDDRIMNVQELLEEYADIRNAKAKLHDFIAGGREGYDFYWLQSKYECEWDTNDIYEEELQSLIDKYGPDVSITDAYDRDNYRLPFPVFETDI
jgi:hypothetical protein